MTEGERVAWMAEAGAPDDLIAEVLGTDVESLVGAHHADLAEGRWRTGERMYRLLVNAAELDSGDAVKVALAWMQSQWWRKRKMAEAVPERVRTPFVQPDAEAWKRAVG